MSETPETPDFDFDAWLDGATVAEVSVDVFQQAGVLGKYDEWERRYDRAEKEAAATAGERSAGEVDPLAALEAEGRQLLEELQASKVVFYMRALDTSVEEAVVKAHPYPEPSAPSFTDEMPEWIDQPTEKQAEAWTAKTQEVVRARKEHEDKHADLIRADEIAREAVNQARAFEKVQRSLSRVEKDGKVIAEGLSIEQIRKLPKQLGDVQFLKIVTAAMHATVREPEVPGDFLHRTSTTDQG